MRWRCWLPTAIGAALAVGLGAGAAVSRFEEQDAFCVSCHTAPEVTYVQRARQARTGDQVPLDLSSAHYASAAAESGGRLFRCIDCHRGDGSLLHRVATLSLGARDALIWISGQADETIEKTEIEVPFLLTRGCERCHLDALLVTGFANHFHNKLPAAWRAWQEGGQLMSPSDQPDLPPSALRLEPSPTSVLCVDCHRAHMHVEGAELQAYLDVSGVVYPTCVRCHEESGHGPLDLAARP
ncbi:MAG: hypothetical protein AB1449_07115 [Chloroflexota bacterium]